MSLDTFGRIVWLISITVLCIFLVLLDLSRQYLFNDIDGIIIRVLVSLRDLFLSLFPCFSLSNFSILHSLYCKSCKPIFRIWKSRRWHLQLAIYDSLNYVIFKNILYTVLFYFIRFFFKDLKYKNTQIHFMFFS
jgi:hypothetical protein